MKEELSLKNMIWETGVTKENISREERSGDAM